MIAQQGTPVRSTGDAPANQQGGGKPRAPIANLFLFAALAAVLFAGGWGLMGSLAAEGPAAPLGEAVAVSGGTFSVDRVAPEHMAPMKMGGFAKQGMNMAMPKNMDMPPEGMERLTVDVTLAAGENADLRFSEEDFRLGGEGMGEVGPHRSALASGTVPAGAAVSGTMTFQVPKEATELVLGFGGGRPVALDDGSGAADKRAGKDDGSHGH